MITTLKTLIYSRRWAIILTTKFAMIKLFKHAINMQNPPQTDTV